MPAGQRRPEPDSTALQFNVFCSDRGELYVFLCFYNTPEIAQTRQPLPLLHIRADAQIRPLRADDPALYAHFLMGRVAHMPLRATHTVSQQFSPLPSMSPLQGLG